MFLHENRELFKDIVERVSGETGVASVVVEKDYYVTMLLKLLSEREDNCVFKGGTSLSKGFNVINRFSEDIDITFTERLGESRRKKLKYNVLKEISETLNMPILNWDKIQSDRDYNAYNFSYESVLNFEDENLVQYVKLETALGSYSFPTEIIEINNYIGDYLVKNRQENVAEKYYLTVFPMKLQSVERTYIDKVFALCDYYIQGKSRRYSRHLYDIYKLMPMIEFNDDFKGLISDVRKQRADMTICPSAKDNVDVSAVMLEFAENDFYKEDYQSVTSYFTTDDISYEDVIFNIQKLAAMKFF